MFRLINEKKMRLAKQCIDYSIALIKINFAFILVLQAMKLFTGMTDIMQNQSVASYNSSSFLSYLKYVAHLWTSNSYDINLMEATKTEVINVYGQKPDELMKPLNKSEFDLSYSNLDDTSKVSSSQNNPYVTFKSFINFTQLIQYNNLKNMVKLVFVLNLNLTTLITNLIVISFLMIKKRTFTIMGVRLGKKFMRSNLVLNIVLLIVLLSINTLYLFIFNGYFKVILTLFVK